MITDCFGAQAGNFLDAEPVFIQTTFSSLKIIIPAAIWLVTWRMCHPTQTTKSSSVLGLDETSSLSTQQPSRFLLPACLAITLFTFVIGLLSVEVYRGLKEALMQMLGLN